MEEIFPNLQPAPPPNPEEPSPGFSVASIMQEMPKTPEAEPDDDELELSAYLIPYRTHAHTHVHICFVS